jgi:hypothetical protein
VNNRITVILFIVLLVGIGGLAYLYIAKPFQKDPLWDGKPKVVYGGDTPSLWWYKGHRNGPRDDAWMNSTDRLSEVLMAHSSEIIDENYCVSYVNAVNNTIFIVSKSLDAEVKQAFLDVIQPPEKVTVLFRESIASYIEIRQWMDLIIEESDTLRDKGVMIWALSVDVNGTLKLGVQDLDKEKVRILLDVMEGKVPPGILVIEEHGPIVLH